jgi:hypothetical protein
MCEEAYFGRLISYAFGLVQDKPSADSKQMPYPEAYSPRVVPISAPMTMQSRQSSQACFRCAVLLTQSFPQRVSKSPELWPSLVGSDLIGFGSCLGLHCTCGSSRIVLAARRFQVSRRLGNAV